MRLLTAIGLSAFTGAIVAILLAVAIGLLKNFTDVGKSLLQKEVFNGPILYGGYGDLILIVLTLIAVVGSFFVFLRSQ